MSHLTLWKNYFGIWSMGLANEDGAEIVQVGAKHLQRQSKVVAELNPSNSCASNFCWGRPMKVWLHPLVGVKPRDRVRFQNSFVGGGGCQMRY
jgi:hypothetical protein